ncbi:hypothetical protein ACN42_g5322 [Penicillium freii]|uniref:Uncharacterized protein n=1 Tax=Penicillium freii TaxID=48697 RepID=A0A101MJN4_PENFR|nr:hypothetical protein ACN42_g5322 [Penicillium freii]
MSALVRRRLGRVGTWVVYLLGLVVFLVWLEEGILAGGFGLLLLILGPITYTPLIAQLEERKTVIALFCKELVILRSLVRSRVRGLFLTF